MDEQKVIEIAKKLAAAWGKPENMFTGSLLSLRLDELKQALAPKERFYVGQPVLVRKEDTQDEVKHVLTCIYPDGRNKYRTIDGRHWQYCKPDPDAVSLPNWIEHDGSTKKIKSEGSLILWIDTFGCHGTCETVMQIGEQVVRYCIIPLPAYLNGGSDG